MRVDFYVVTALLPDKNPETLIQIEAPANQRINIVAMDLGLQGTTPATTPIIFDFAYQSGAQIPDGSEITPEKADRGYNENIQGNFRTFTSTGQSDMPATNTTIIEFSLHQQAYTPWRPPFPIIIIGGEKVGLRYKSSTFVNLSVTLYCTQ